VVETKTQHPGGLFDLPDVPDGALGKMLRRELLLALIPFLLLAGGSFIAVHRLPHGKAFILESRGRGLFYDFMSALMLFVFFGFVWMAPSMWVRRSISIAYRVTFFLIFTVGLFWAEGRNYIAVVQTPQSFIFIRRFPLPSTSVSASSLTSISIRKTKAIAALQARSADAPHLLECQRVWLKDPQTTQVMAELAAELELAQGAPHKPVAPATATRSAPEAR
jgi:hypothetical protein